MNIKSFFAILGLLTEMLGAFILIKSNLFTNPTKLQEALRSIHGNRIRDKDLDRNKFLNNLLLQSLEAQAGFIILIIGLMFQVLGILIGNICSLSVLLSVIIIIAFLLFLYICAAKINKRRRKKAKQCLLKINL